MLNRISFVYGTFLLVVQPCTLLATPRIEYGSDGTPFYIEPSSKYNWFQASHECARQNLQLAEIHTAEKNKILVEVLDSIFAKPRNLWLGANDEYSLAKNLSRPFYWSSSGQRVTFSYWTQGQPDNLNSTEHCLHTWTRQPHFQWNDADCLGYFGFICEPKQ